MTDRICRERPETTPETGLDALQTLLLWSPFVIGMRLPVLAGETMMFSQADKTETNRLVGEKLGAFMEGAIAAHGATVSAMLGFAQDAVRMTFDVGSVTRAAESIFKAGVDPAAARVRDNAERLMLAAG